MLKDTFYETCNCAIATPTANYIYNKNNSSGADILSPSLEERLTAPITSTTSTTPTTEASFTASSLLHIAPAIAFCDDFYRPTKNFSTMNRVVPIVVSNFRSPPLTTTTTITAAIETSAEATIMTTIQPPLTTMSNKNAIIIDKHLSQNVTKTNAAISNAQSTATAASAAIIVNNQQPTNYYLIFNPPSIENLVVANSTEEYKNNFHHHNHNNDHHYEEQQLHADNDDDLPYDIFEDNADNLYDSSLKFDASENGLWNGRFVPPPPRPPFLTDDSPKGESNISNDGLTTCDLCSWAMPPNATKSTSFIFDSSMEKASGIGWPLTLMIVSILSALLGAIIMITVVKCRRRKTSQSQRSSSETHVQCWSRNKRPNTNHNHLRRSNIYTAHPVDNIRGLQANSLSESSLVSNMLNDVMPSPPAASTLGSGSGPGLALGSESISANATHLVLYHHANLLPEHMHTQLQSALQSQSHAQAELQSHLQQLKVQQHSVLAGEYDLQTHSNVMQQTQDLDRHLQQQHNDNDYQHDHSNHQCEREHVDSLSQSSSSKTNAAVQILYNNNVIDQHKEQQKQQQQIGQYKLHDNVMRRSTEQIHLPENNQLEDHQQHQQQQQQQQQWKHEMQENLFQWPTTTTTLVTS